MQTPNIGAQRARLFTEARLRERARHAAVYNTAPHIVARAAKHRELAEAALQWVRLADDPRLAAFAGNVDEHRAAAEREYQLAYEEEN
jgi:hypothetical protein